MRCIGTLGGNMPMHRTPNNNNIYLSSAADDVVVRLEKNLSVSFLREIIPPFFGAAG